MNKFESRYFNTATTLDEALIEMLKIKEYRYITISEICKKAGVNRSTFYLHYEKIDDLLNEVMIKINNAFADKFVLTKMSGKRNILALNDKILISKEYLIPYLEYIKDNGFIFKCYKDNPIIFKSDDVFKRINIEIFTPIMNEFKVPKDEQAYFVEYYCHGILAIVYHWISSDFKEPVEKIFEIISKCTKINNI